MVSPQQMLFSVVKAERIPPKIRNKTRVSTFTTITQLSSGSPSYSNQRRKRNKRNQIRKEVKLSLLADDMMLYIKNPKESIRKLLISEFSNVAGCKTNTQKSLTFLYPDNEKSEKLRNQSHSPLQQKG